MKKITLLLLSSLFMLNMSYSQRWNEIIKSTASDRGAGDQYGYSVSISGNYAIVGAYVEQEDVLGGAPLSYAGSAYILEKDGAGMWNEVQKIVASDREVSGFFGYSVSISGDYAVVGSHGEDEDALGGGGWEAGAGAAYIFERNGSGVWTEVQKIVASDRTLNDEFGYAVSVSGNYIIVGAHYEDEDTTGNNTLANAGSAYVFKRDGAGVWNQTQKLVASDRGISDYFGSAVSISGNHAIVGAYNNDEDALGGNTQSNAGAVYVYELSGGVFTEVQKIVATDRSADDLFGYSVSISGDYAIIGAYGEDEDELGGNPLSYAGSAYVFERNGAGVWNEVQKLVANDRQANAYFGYSVGISGDYLVVGASYENKDATGMNPLFGAGAAYVYLRTGANWIQLDKIVASDREDSDQFGYAVGISDTIVMAGARSEDENVLGGDSLNSSGAVYFFKECYSADTLNLTVCDSLVSPSGNYVWNTSGTYLDTIPNTQGCDSLLTIHLTVDPTIDNTVTNSSPTLMANQAGATYRWLDCDNGNAVIPGATNQSFTASTLGNYAVEITAGSCIDTSACIFVDQCQVTSTLDTTMCASYDSPSGNYVWTNSGTYLDTIPTVAGVCDSVITINLTIDPAIDNTVTTSMSTLTSNQAGASYQWLDCNNGNAIISGETGQSFTATANGGYAVEITAGTCVDTSACTYLTTVGVVELPFQRVSVYPNPTEGILSIDLGSNAGIIDYTVTTLEGRIVKQGRTTDNKIVENLSEESKGFYLLQLKDKTESKVYKIIKQ